MTSQPRPMRVLVIDDDPMSRDLLSVLLQAEGYEVECVGLRRGRNHPHPPHRHRARPRARRRADAGPHRRTAGRRTPPRLPPGDPPAGDERKPPARQDLARFDGFLLKPFTMKQVAAVLAAQSPPSGATNPPAKRERWTVVRGPAGRSPSNPRLVSISASRAGAGRIQQRTAQPTSAGAARRGVPGSNPGGLPVLNEKIYQRLAASMPAPQLRQLYAMCLNDVRTRIAPCAGLRKRAMARPLCARPIPSKADAECWARPSCTGWRRSWRRTA